MLKFACEVYIFSHIPPAEVVSNTPSSECWPHPGQGCALVMLTRSGLQEARCHTGQPSALSQHQASIRPSPAISKELGLEWNRCLVIPKAKERNPWVATCDCRAKGDHYVKPIHSYVTMFPSPVLLRHVTNISLFSLPQSQTTLEYCIFTLYFLRTEEWLIDNSRCI